MRSTTSNHWRATPLREVKPSLSPAHRLQETRPPSRLGSILSYRELPALAFPIPVRSRAMFRIMGSRPICNCAFRMFDKGTPIIEDVRIGICPSMGLETMNLRLPLSFSQCATSTRSEEHTSELQSLMRISYAVFCLKKKKIYKLKTQDNH